MNGFGFFSRTSNVFDRPNEEVARNGTAEENRLLAERQDLDREVLLILAETTNIDTLISLPMNYTTPADHATDDEARALVQQRDKVLPPGCPLLGDIWAQICTEQLP